MKTNSCGSNGLEKAPVSLLTYLVCLWDVNGMWRFVGVTKANLICLFFVSSLYGSDGVD